MKKSFLVLPLVLALGACATESKKAQAPVEPVLITTAYQCGDINKGPAVKFTRLDNFATLPLAEARATLDVNGETIAVHRVETPVGLLLQADDETSPTKFAYADETSAVLTVEKRLLNKKARKGRVVSLKCVGTIND